MIYRDFTGILQGLYVDVIGILQGFYADGLFLESCLFLELGCLFLEHEVIARALFGSKGPFE